METGERRRRLDTLLAAFAHLWRPQPFRQARPAWCEDFPALTAELLALPEAEAELRDKLTPETLAAIVNLVPDAWLRDEPRFATPDAHRAAYVEYLVRRLEASPIFVEEALRARSPRL